VIVYLGCPYVWGGTGPCANGYDCSGLVYAAYAAARIHIARTTHQWQQDGLVVPSRCPMPLTRHLSSGTTTTLMGGRECATATSFRKGTLMTVDAPFGLCEHRSYYQ
jgi:cell wall-associated NlpC family hydrolase